MYSFVDHNSHDYITDAFDSCRSFEPDPTVPQPGADGTAPRPVLPTGFADESLLSFSHDELTEGWETAQTAQLIGATFFEMFDTNTPDYHGIVRAAHAWLVNLTDAFHGDEGKAEEFRVARQLLQGVIDAARAGIAGRPTRWSPWRRGLNLDVHGPTPTPGAEELGAWFDALGLDGGAWQVRKAGDGVEAVRMSDGTSITLTRAQARRSLSITGRAA